MKVLLCEDDSGVSSVLAELLESEGIRAIIAETIKQAHALLDDHEIKAVIMDGNMPMEAGARIPKRSTDILVEYILSHRAELRGRILAYAGHPDDRDKIILVGATGVRGHRQDDDPVGVYKPSYRPIIDKLKEFATAEEK